MQLNQIKEKIKEKAQKFFDVAKNIHALSNVTDFAGTKSQSNFDRTDKVSRKELSHLMGLDYARFSSILPYRYYDFDQELFINDQSIGFGLELAPLAGANEEIIHSISELLKNKISDDVCIQVMMVGNNKVGHLLSEFSAPYFKQGDIFKAIGKNQYDYLKHAAIKGFTNKRNISMQLKDYRCFLFASKRSGYSKKEAAFLCDLRDSIASELKNTGIPNVKLVIESFIELTYSLINPNQNCIDHRPFYFDKYDCINKQCVSPNFYLHVDQNHLIVESETKIKLSEYEKLLLLQNNENNQINKIDKTSVSKTHIVSLSLTQLPDELALWTQADNFSNIFKPNHGIHCPFVISVHFKCEPQERSKLKAYRKASELEKKANSPYAKLIPGTVQAAQEWKKIRDDLATNETKLCKAYFNCVLFTNEKDEREHVSNAISAFRLNNFDLYPVKFQHLQSFLSVLPFVVEQGMWLDLSVLGRLNTMTTWNLSNMLPLVAEYKGAQHKKGVFAPTFRHQAAVVDLFDQGLDNFNACICATSGSGKSVLSQALITSVLADGGQAWVIDLGESYKKFCKTINGTYMDVATLKLNPFSNVTDITKSAESIRDLIAVMASPAQGLVDVQKAHLLDAVHAAFKKNKHDANIDDVIDYLQSIDSSDRNSNFDLRVDDIVTLLKKFSLKHAPKDSIAARIFNSKSQLQNNNESLVVLELGELENQPDLLKSVLFALILHIEESMYHGDKNRKKLCVIDEAWRLLSGSNKTAASFIERGYRTARKHNASFVTITQQVNDFYASLEAQAAWSCAETKIIMRQSEKAFKDFLTTHPDYFDTYQQTLIKSFRPSALSGFSEFMVQQGQATSFHRLFLDPVSRIMFSSKASEHKAVEDLVLKGMRIGEAIEMVARSLFQDEMNSIANLK